jgi:hypothetical protein
VRGALTILGVLNGVVDIPIVLTAIVLTWRYRRNQRAALLALTIGFWFRTIAFVLAIASPYLLPVGSADAVAPGGISPTLIVEEAIGQAIQVLTIGSYLFIVYGALIAPISRRSRAHRT